jgi:glycine dehydrogenase
MTTFRSTFAGRHIGPDEHDIKKMLDVIGVSTLDELINETIPESIRIKTGLNLGEPFSESELLSLFKEYASQNKLYKTYIGYGYYGTFTPSVILRNIMENPDGILNIHHTRRKFHRQA